MKTINLAQNLRLPLEVASQATCIVGLRGSGKTNSARSMAEELLKAGVPICVIDPTDAWYGLRSSRDGKHDGYPVFVFGGDHGDLPLSETDGKVIAEFLVNDRVPVVLSLRHLRKGAQRRFVTELCEELYHLKGKPENRSPLTMFIDESPLFIPQRADGEVARTIGAVEDMINRGRNTGFGVVLISQRFATVNKNVTTQSDMIICHRVTSPQDRKALAEWIEENATIEEQKATLASLATLKDGEAWVWNPRVGIYLRAQVRLSETFDSGATPKMGEKIATPKKLAEIDKEKLKQRLAKTIEKAKADDPKELKKRIAELERQTKANQATLVQAPQKRITVPVITDAQINRIESSRTKLADQILKIAEKHARMIDELIAKTALAFNPLIDRFRETDKRVTEILASTKAFSDPRWSPKTTFSVRHGYAQPSEVGKSAGPFTHRFKGKTDSAHLNAAPANGDALPVGERKILTACAQYPDGLDRSQITVLTGYKRSSRDAYISRLIPKGYLRVDRDGVIATQEGIVALGDFEPLPVGEKLREYWLNRLPVGEKRILEVVVKEYPHAVDRNSITDATGYKRSSRDAYISRMIAKRIIESESGGVIASDTLFGVA